jgi:hypothetical protein
VEASKGIWLWKGTPPLPKLPCSEEVDSGVQCPQTYTVPLSLIQNKRKTLLFNKIMILLLLGILGLLFLIGIEIINKKKYRSVHANMSDVLNKRALSIPKDETIFIVLPMYRPNEPVKLLDTVFRNAFCPQRISVGILEHNVIGTPQVADVYYNAQQAGNVLPFSHNIRYHLEPPDTIYGASVARQIIVDKFYQGEMYVLFLTQNCILASNWDKLLVDSLHRAHALGGHVISQFPCEAPVSHDLPTTFPVFHRFEKQNIPIFKGRFITSNSRQPFRSSMASFKCLFGTADVLLKKLSVHTPGLPFIKHAAANLLLSAELWTRGYHIFTPSYSVLVDTGTNIFKSRKDVKNKKLKLFTRDVVNAVLTGTSPKSVPLYIEKLTKNQQRTVPQFLAWIGVQPADRHISGQTVLGLLPEYTQLEIVHKFGSMQNFNRFKEQFTYLTE